MQEARISNGPGFFCTHTNPFDLSEAGMHTQPMPPDLRLSTSRLTLRSVSPADRADLIALEADAEVMRYLNGGQPVPDAGLCDADFLTPRGEEPEVLVAHHRTSGTFIGWFALFNDGLIDGLRTAEIGYRLSRAAWGSGYATEGVCALVAAAFDSMGFDKVRAETMAVNLASRRVLEKAGLRQVQTVFPKRAPPIPGAELGEVIYAIRKTRKKPRSPVRMCAACC
jgi:RimJ/RimL family protein N-acetyltransferase